MKQRPFLTFILALLTLVFLLDAFQDTSASESNRAGEGTDSVTSNQPAYGVNFISWAGSSPVSEIRYQNGLSTGAAWNRWPMYWNDIEQSEGLFSWAYQDVTAVADITHGLQINAILLGTPWFYTTNFAALQPTPPPFDPPPGPLFLDTPQTATPMGLYDAVFNDGTDIPGAGQSINPNNKWARFVFTAVSRYKPGGIVAQQAGWPAGVGITHWEMWNEPDLSFFWDGTTADYARLLKVGYLAAKQADGNAQILFGGLANASNNINFYNNVMAIYDGDALANSYGFFHDILATHNYFYSWESWLHVWRAGNTLATRGLVKPIWLNESGVPVWDDYPGPICEPDSPLRATMSEQADFIIQSALYATFAGADNLFHFQLYDDCGNVPGNHDYYSPDSCSPDVVEPGGDAFGLFRNPNDPIYCFTHHPLPETARPGYDAYRVLTRYFTQVEPLWRLRPGEQEWLSFYQPESGERLTGMWMRFGNPATAVLTSTNAAGTGTLITPDGLTQTIQAQNGLFHIDLPAATNQNAPWDPTLYPIGGRPYLLTESETVPPVVSANGPVTAETEIPITWSGSDYLGSGVINYDVTVKIDDGLELPWLMTTTTTAAAFPGEKGHIYTFTIYGRDRAGNVSGGTAVKVITKDLPERQYFPIIHR